MLRYRRQIRRHLPSLGGRRGGPCRGILAIRILLVMRRICVHGSHGSASTRAASAATDAPIDGGTADCVIVGAAPPIPLEP